MELKMEQNLHERAETTTLLEVVKSLTGHFFVIG